MNFVLQFNASCFLGKCKDIIKLYHCVEPTQNLAAFFTYPWLIYTHFLGAYSNAKKGLRLEV